MRAQLPAANFDGDAFISYAHMDNMELVEGHRGWVSNLHRALEVRVGQLLGKAPHIWRDPKLQGNDFFEETLVQRLKHVAALVPVVSPRYVKSEWTRKELDEFWRAAREQGGVCFQDKVRVFKVLKTPVPLQLHPPELQPLLGYEFFKVDPETGRVRELDEIFGPEAQRDFWLKLDDLAHDICTLLEMVQNCECGDAEAVAPQRAPIFLAETTSDLVEQREAIRRDLQQHGYTILPVRSMPLVASDLKSMLREDLARCQMSIHLVGKNYSLVPEGAVESLLEIQNHLAIERYERGQFTRLLWIPPGLEVDDNRQRSVIEHFRSDPKTLSGADLLETFLEDLKTVIHERLKPTEKPRPRAQARSENDKNLRRVYLICDQRDVELTSAWGDFLFNQKIEVMRPVFDGDEAEIRDYHEENLRTCDGALIFYGSANECWLRRKLRELQKSAGYGRGKSAPTVGIALVLPRTAEKERFRTHEAMVIPQFEGFSAEPLREFLAQLQA